ncbi:MAG TPA: urea transporter [Paludibacter sp.]|nr:urea transporter [Paludibacter sp.]
MPQTKFANTLKHTFLPGILNSYSIIFFSNNRLMASVLIMVSFFNFYAGLSGLFAVVLSIALGKALHLNETDLRTGVYSFNALLTGLGMGTFFDPGLVFFSLLVIMTMFCLFISVSLGGWLHKYNLPHLSIPFVISTWFLMLPASQFENLGLTQRSIYWLNEMYAVGGKDLVDIFQSIDSFPINKLVDIYLRSLSSMFFQSNLVSGLCIALALVASSRILFSLSVVGFLSAYLFAHFTGSEAASLTYYNIGANYMMVAFAVGGFFIIPSKKSYFWTIFLVPLTSLVLLFFFKLLGFIQLPVFSLPFSFVVILFLYFLQQRSKTTGLHLTPYQHYSPEINLYTFRSNSERFSNLAYKIFSLPFWGEWTVTQGYDGKFTHLGEWGKALDFMIKDSNGLTCRGTGLLREDYFCFKKPVVAIADGVVEAVADDIEDNEIGKINTENNWGNSVVIHHYNGVYSQVSHLRKGSVKVKPGDFVKAGEIIAQCGNSGRSPEPHLHFQIQYQPAIGSKTKVYPIAYFYSIKDKEVELNQFAVPAENELVSNVNPDNILAKAFNILPEDNLKFSFADHKNRPATEEWNAYIDAYNNKYLLCRETGDVAYYVYDGKMFYFTTYYGGKKSLLYHFFLGAYKVFLNTAEQITVQDYIPLNYIGRNKLLVWLNDFISPFKNIVNVRFTSCSVKTERKSNANQIELESETQLVYPGKTSRSSQSTVTIAQDGIREFKVFSDKINIRATCIK